VAGPEGGEMGVIDDEAEVEELLRDMESRLPIPVRPVRELVETLTRGGVACRPNEDLEIGSVLYMGDIGGIACGLRVYKCWNRRTEPRKS